MSRELRAQLKAGFSEVSNGLKTRLLQLIALRFPYFLVFYAYASVELDVAS